MFSHLAVFTKYFQNYNNIQKTKLLFDGTKSNTKITDIIETEEIFEFNVQNSSIKNYFFKLISSSGYKISPLVFLICCIFFGLSFYLLSSVLIPFPLSILFFFLGFSTPILHLEKKSTELSSSFEEDYPTLLLASASSLKTGLSPQVALKRAALLLPKKSPVRKEALKLLDLLHKGIQSEKALSLFAKNIDLPELALFRAAFSLVLKDGGKLSQTLERIALVSRDRISLKSQARVSTTNMKMTANIILAITPFILFLVAVRQEDFWELIRFNQTANLFASLGFILIILGYISLKLMSRFKS